MFLRDVPEELVDFDEIVQGAENQFPLGELGLENFGYLLICNRLFLDSEQRHGGDMEHLFGDALFSRFLHVADGDHFCEFDLVFDVDFGLFGHFFGLMKQIVDLLFLLG